MLVGKTHPVSRRRGMAVLDMSLCLGVLLSLAFGTVEFGHFFYLKNTLQGAAREGARAAIIPGSTNATVTTAVAGVLNAAGFNSSATTLDANYTLTTTPATISGVAAGTNVTVQISCPWGTEGLRPLGLIGSNKVVAGIAVMRHE